MNRKRIRTDFRKNRSSRTRQKDWTGLADGGEHTDESSGSVEHSAAERSTRRTERISGKGDLSRRRTVVAAAIVEEDGASRIIPEIDLERTLVGRVLSVHGVHSFVQEDPEWNRTGRNAGIGRGRIWRCTTRRRLWTLASDARHAVVVGDRVRFTPASHEQNVNKRSNSTGRDEHDPCDDTVADDVGPPDGTIERVELRHGCFIRESRRQKHVVVANVDQILIVVSAAQPELKPELIDRMILVAERSGMRPLVCVNKCDLVDRASLMPLVGQFARMDYPVLLVSATTGLNMERLRREVARRETAVVGQSGVGKTSLLRALDPTLDLAVRAVSRENEKGRHTTTAARLVPLAGGYMVDTPGIRQFQLWDVIPAEVINAYRDLRPYINHCRWPDCTHTVEDECAVKNAVADGHLDERRYESYCHLREDHTIPW